MTKNKTSFMYGGREVKPLQIDIILLCSDRLNL